MRARRASLVVALAIEALALGACGDDRPPYDAGEMPVDSPAFARGGAIPKKYTGDGADVSPPLSWKGVPAAAKELAIVVQDADAGSLPMAHWVLYGIPPTVTSIPEGIARGPQPVAEAGGALQGTNDVTHELGWSGPNPPPGTSFHRYEFWVFALDQPLKLAAGVDRATFLAAAKSHMIEKSRLLATYEH
jgi:Raf kinase inhibitor-like YbhB/YbcL family protein